MLYICDHIYNTAYRRFFAGWVQVEGGRIAAVGEGDVPAALSAEPRADFTGMYIVPGLIDCHMHIESSMMAPAPFAAAALRHGTTTVVSEPHEIANVKGLAGVRAMIEAGRKVPLDIFIGVPSSVPSTDDTLETAGGAIELEDLRALLDDPAVICLGEVMNTRAVITDAPHKHKDFIRAVKERRPLLPIEGHCPTITGLDLCRYLCEGIDSDHTEHTLEELRQRLFHGVLFELQEKMLRSEIVRHIVDNRLYESIALVTDDVMPDTLVHSGQLDRVLRLAIELGFPVEQAIYCCTAVPARRMLLLDRGAIAPGKIADFVVVDSPERFDVIHTYKNGREVYAGGEIAEIALEGSAGAFPADFYGTVKLSPRTEADFAFAAPVGAGEVSVNVMNTFEVRTQTEWVIENLPTEGGLLRLPAGYNKIMAFERYGKNGNVGRGVVKGDSVLRGAVASTYAHDHHNLIVLGDNDRDMAAAANAVVVMGGGIAVADGGEITAQLELPVGGIMAEGDPRDVARDMAAVTVAMVRQGYRNQNPVMSFCTLCLPVSPALKITDCGLVDVRGSRIVPLYN